MVVSNSVDYSETVVFWVMGYGSLLYRSDSILNTFKGVLYEILQTQYW